MPAKNDDLYCIASNTPEENHYALQHMRNVLQANIMPSSELDWSKLRQHTSIDKE